MLSEQIVESGPDGKGAQLSNEPPALHKQCAEKHLAASGLGQRFRPKDQLLLGFNQARIMDVQA